MSDNSNNVHFSGVRFICNPDLASLRSIIERLRNENEDEDTRLN